MLPSPLVDLPLGPGRERLDRYLQLAGCRLDHPHRWTVLGVRWVPQDGKTGKIRDQGAVLTASLTGW